MSMMCLALRLLLQIRPYPADCRHQFQSSLLWFLQVPQQNDDMLFPKFVLNAALLSRLGPVLTQILTVWEEVLITGMKKEPFYNLIEIKWISKIIPTCSVILHGSTPRLRAPDGQ